MSTTIYTPPIPTDAWCISHYFDAELEYQHPLTHPEIFSEEFCSEAMEPWNKGISTNDYVNNGATEAARLVNTGKCQTTQHKQKRAASKSRTIEIEGISYSSGKAAAESLGYSISTISTWAKRAGSRTGISIPTGSNQWIDRRHE